jgi:uncharacterized protein YrrD
MLRSIKSLNAMKLLATDGDIGKVKDFYFDDRSWSIRYLIVDTGTWLPGRKVLISPVSCDKPDGKLNKLPVNLTKDEIKNSPDIHVDKPVSRQQLIELYKYYGWPPYWTTSGAWVTPVPPLAPEIKEEQTSQNNEENDPHLRSIKEVINYRIYVKDGEIGHVEDFILNDESWVILYFIVDTRNWLPGKQVMLATSWIYDIDWGHSTVSIDLTKDAVRNSPRYDPDAPVNREYEVQIYDYYGRPKYWE